MACGDAPLPHQPVGPDDQPSTTRQESVAGTPDGPHHIRPSQATRMANMSGAEDGIGGQILAICPSGGRFGLLRDAIRQSGGVMPRVHEQRG